MKKNKKKHYNFFFIFCSVYIKKIKKKLKLQFFFLINNMEI